MPTGTRFRVKQTSLRSTGCLAARFAVPCVNWSPQATSRRDTESAGSSARHPEFPIASEAVRKATGSVAHDLAESLLADSLPQRWAHSQTVYSQALTLAPARGEDAELCEAFQTVGAGAQNASCHFCFHRAVERRCRCCFAGLGGTSGVFEDEVHVDGAACGVSGSGGLGHGSEDVADVPGGPHTLDAGESGGGDGDLEAGNGGVGVEGEAEVFEEAAAGGEGGSDDECVEGDDGAGGQAGAGQLVLFGVGLQGGDGPWITSMPRAASCSHCSSVSSPCAWWAKRVTWSVI